MGIVLVSFSMRRETCVAQSFYPASFPSAIETSQPQQERFVTNNDWRHTPIQGVSAPLPNRIFPRRESFEQDSRYSGVRVQTARQSASQLRLTAQTSDPALAAVAIQNAEFIEQWANLADSYQELCQRTIDANARLTSTSRDLLDVKSKLATYGLTPTVGLLLQHKNQQLDSLLAGESPSLFTRNQMKQLRQQQLELELVPHDGSDANNQTLQIIRNRNVSVNSLPNRELASQIQGLLVERYQWIDWLRSAYVDYQYKLDEYDSITVASEDLNLEYRELIDRNIIWIRSGEPIAASDFRKLKPGLATLLDSRRNEELGYFVQQKWRRYPTSGVTLVCWIVLISLVRWIAKSSISAIGSRKRLRSAGPTLRKAAVATLTVIVPFAIPAILFLMAKWLSVEMVSESSLNVAAALYAASLIALMIEVPRQLLRDGGYVERYVAVELPRRTRAIQYLTLIGTGLVLAAYVVTLMTVRDHGLWRDSVGRFGFFAAMLLVAWTMHLALRPTRGFLEPLIATFGGSVIHRLRFLVYVAGVGFPLAMLILSAIGYGYTANELITRVIHTMVVMIIMATLWPSVKEITSHGWQMLTGTMPPPKRYDAYGEIAAEKPSIQTNAQYLDLKHHLAFLCQCALVIAGVVVLGQQWIDVFPNVRVANPVVWNIEELVSESMIDDRGETVVTSSVQSRPITAMHLISAAAILFVAFQLAKLLPALFDALVLQRVSFDEGMEHFIFVMGRCLLFGIGCYLACQMVGVRWQTIQWLAVGLTIGIGFGLQDMVRNLFGGVIVLFEKPARLGDLITVGKFTGRVAAQTFRTTVLSDDEGREVIVPNKNFVNEEVVQWMGAGRLTVIPIEVSVTKDQRPADICRKIQELVIEQPDILLTPAPQATLVCVSKHAQRIEVRAWIENSKDAERFRDSLLRVVTRYLDDKSWLASPQPVQPRLSNRFNDLDDDSQSKRRTRRSA